jgi:flagellar basal body rod protein FlgC
MSAFSISLQGMQQADEELQVDAANLSNINTESAGGGNSDTVDLSSDAVSMMQAQVSFEASLASLNTAEQTQQALLDVLA